MGTLFTQYGLFPQGNVQVTSGNPKQARSESVVATNPKDTQHLIAASKKFSNPATYRFAVGVRVSSDGGLHWPNEVKLPTLPEWGDFGSGPGQDAVTGMTDPATTFDDFGNAFLVGEPIRFQQGGQIDTVGMYVYKSTDNGLTWGAPKALHVGDLSDDKAWIASDNTPSSLFYGHVYIVWGAGSPLRFARSVDHGASWTGVGTSATGTSLANVTFGPEISVGPDGVVHIAWHMDGGTTVEYMRSTDGGATFEAQKSIATNVKSLRNSLDIVDGWPHFPGATFRVITVVTGCAFRSRAFGWPGGPGGPFGWTNPHHYIVAWSDYREGAARIYYRASSDGGATFTGPVEGTPLLAPNSVPAELHHFHPQIVATRNGVVGCAYYEYGPKGGKNLIDVLLSASRDHGNTFTETATVTQKPWDPAIDAPFSHGDPKVTFIGEYFGLDVSESAFDVLWTDTRTGVQELFFDRIQTQREHQPKVLDGIVEQILFGVIQDGGGVVFVNGHFIRIPPRGPEFDVLQALVALDAAKNMQGPAGAELTRGVFKAIEQIAQLAGKQLHG
jgi:hypothetical protein